MKIGRALLSVSDKRGLVPLARCLSELGCELIATGGTRRALLEADLPVTEIAAVTGNPEAFGGRMKTISFAVASALLFDRDRDATEARRLGIEPIDLVVCNLYPFEAHRDAGAELDTLVEHIDIGGPTMIRAAAKNFRWVAVATSPDQYGAIEDELRASDGELSLDTRHALMRAAFNHTADYDAAIAVEMDRRAGAESLRFAYADGKPLRYGENSHQSAAVFREVGAETSLADLEVLGGKELSYNNLVDLHGALSAVRDLPSVACAVIKHTNPCGLAVASDPRVALEAAWAGDPISAFGSVIAFNDRVTRAAVEFFELDSEDKKRRKFVEAVVAPAIDDDAVELLRVHENLRIVLCDPAASGAARTFRQLPGALLAQDADDVAFAQRDVVTEAQPEGLDDALLTFGAVASRQVKSNAIVLVRRRDDGTLQLLGMGAGQPNRVQSVRLALEAARATLAAEHTGPEEAREDYVTTWLARAALFSDAFFPFPDSIQALADAGVRTVVQPGGSIRDKGVIKRANKLGVAMIFTGTRHFLH